MAQRLEIAMERTISDDGQAPPRAIRRPHTVASIKIGIDPSESPEGPLREQSVSLHRWLGAGWCRRRGAAAGGRSSVAAAGPDERGRPLHKSLIRRGSSVAQNCCAPQKRGRPRPPPSDVAAADAPRPRHTRTTTRRLRRPATAAIPPATLAPGPPNRRFRTAAVDCTAVPACVSRILPAY